MYFMLNLSLSYSGVDALHLSYICMAKAEIFTVCREVRLWTVGQPDSHLISNCEGEVLDVEFNHFEILACTKKGDLYIWDFLEETDDFNHSVQQ